MRNRIVHRLMILACMCVTMPFAAMAQTDEKPLIEFKTAILEQNGDEVGRTVTIFLGGHKQETDYIDFDCGNGLEEHELSPATIDVSTGDWDGGTSITCNVTEEGIVRIWGDPENIAVIRFDGCYITDLTMQEMPNLYYINLDHNLLHELDLSAFSGLGAISVSDNPFDRKPLKIGADKPRLMVLEMGQIDHIDPDFNISDYPELISFDAYASKGLYKVDPTKCTKLQRLSIDGTNVSSLDLSNNPNITILNISDTGIKSVDLSNLTYLQQFYADHQSSTMNTDCKLTSLDVTKNEKLVYLFASGNLFEEIDLSHNYYLQNLYLADNKLTSINLDNNPQLLNVILRKNNMDFATLPFPGEWNQYDYNQNNMPIAKSVKVGDVIDLSARVLREGTTTTCGVYMTSEDVAGKRTLLSEEYYTYADGKVTFLQAPEDSVYIAFANDKFPDLTLDYMPLRTEKFMVKTAENFGQDDMKVTINPVQSSTGITLSMKVGMAGATADNPKTFYISDKDGNKTQFLATTGGLPSENNVSYQTTSDVAYILVPQDELLTALEIRDQSLADINVTKARSLGDLRLVGTGLSQIDLGYNRGLRNLEITGNHFSTLNIRGTNDAYQKNLLQDINLSNNGLTEVTLNDMGTIRNLNLSHNQLAELSLKDADNMQTLDLSYNLLTTANLSYCTLMTDCNLSHNNISEVVMPDENSLQNFFCNDNCLSFATLPRVEAGIHYVYAPQNKVAIAAKAPGVDLQSHNVDGCTTFVWKKTDGSVLTEGTDYTITDGMTRFLTPVVGNLVYCEMTNSVFSGLTLVTTDIMAADMPSYKIGTFTTTEDGTGTLVLRSSSPTTICIDWKGGGVAVESYSVTNDLNVCEVTTHAGGECAIYAYEEKSPLYVFSTNSVKMKDVDLTNMKSLVLVNLTNSGISEVKLPDSNDLAELILDNNNLTDIDLSRYASQLRMLSINNNQLTSFDASAMKNLLSLGIANNQLTSIKLANPDMYNLEASGNQLTEIDLSKAPGLSQVFLSNNLLEHIDITPLRSIVALHIDYNRFRISTLPVISKYASYQYGNQANLDAVADENGVVDLSSEALVGDSVTLYRWFVGEPWYDENTGELTGEELYYDDEVFVRDGVSTFSTPIDGVVCAMTNNMFPNLTLCTNPLDVVTTGIKGVPSGCLPRVRVEGGEIVFDAGDVQSEVYATSGARVARVSGMGRVSLPAGIYLVRSGNSAVKVRVR
ncbi:MAG: leucine-rich repeat domain-containing protein [Bacteroidaceae bacterium]